MRLMYSRRESNDERIIARLVAMQNGKITAKIEPESDGSDNREAFLALKKDVEVRLDRVLQGVPSGSNSAATATPSDAPPAYGGPAAVGEGSKIKN